MAGAKRVPVVSSPVMRKPEPVAERPQEQRKAKPGWCKFQSRTRCYVEGVLLESPEQDITLSPAGSYRQRNSKVLYLVEGVVPVFQLLEGIDKKSQEARDAEAAFVEDLDDGDPKVGAVQTDFKLIKQ